MVSGDVEIPVSGDVEIPVSGDVEIPVSGDVEIPVSGDVEIPVSDANKSLLGPGSATQVGKIHELTNMDLVMKLHYLKGVYFFKSEAVQGITISDFRQAMLRWLDIYYHTCGRIRLSDTGRPFIKCNNIGVGIVEERRDETIDEWLAMKDHSLRDVTLAHGQVIGPHPDLGSTPLVFIQLTWFKCGGISVGLSWAHVLGDAFTATNFINMWANIMAGHKPSPMSLKMPNSGKFEFPPSIPNEPFSVKRVDPVRDRWETANNCKMETHSFRVTARGLHKLRTCGLGQAAKIPPFEILCAIIWKSLAKIRGESWPKRVTVCRKNSLCEENEITTNGQVVGTVEAEFSAAEAELSDLALQLIAEKVVDERSIIEGMMEKDEKMDVVVYGAKLTFVNLEDANIYGLEFKGHKPIFANYSIGGVGDEGVVLVLPWLENGKEEGGSGRILTVTLPENELAKLKIELKREWAILFEDMDYGGNAVSFFSPSSSV